MGRRQFLSCFQFKYYAVVDYDISFKFPYNFAIIVNIYRHLRNTFKTFLLEFKEQGILVNLFKEPKTEFIIYSKIDFDDIACQVRM